MRWASLPAAGDMEGMGFQSVLELHNAQPGNHAIPFVSVRGKSNHVVFPVRQKVTCARPQRPGFLCAVQQGARPLPPPPPPPRANAPVFALLTIIYMFGSNAYIELNERHSRLRSPLVSSAYVLVLCWLCNTVRYIVCVRRHSRRQIYGDEATKYYGSRYEFAIAIAAGNFKGRVISILR